MKNNLTAWGSIVLMILVNVEFYLWREGLGVSIDFYNIGLLVLSICLVFYEFKQNRPVLSVVVWIAVIIFAYFGWLMWGITTIRG